MQKEALYKQRLIDNPKAEFARGSQIDLLVHLFGQTVTQEERWGPKAAIYGRLKLFTDCHWGSLHELYFKYNVPKEAILSIARGYETKAIEACKAKFLETATEDDWLHSHARGYSVEDCTVCFCLYLPPCTSPNVLWIVLQRSTRWHLFSALHVTRWPLRLALAMSSCDL
jgi:hypothetical protein